VQHWESSKFKQVNVRGVKTGRGVLSKSLHVSVHLGDSCKGTPCVCSQNHRPAPVHAATPHCPASQQKQDLGTVICRKSSEKGTAA